MHSAVRGRSLLRRIGFVLSIIGALVIPSVAFADGPITVDQMLEIASSGGNADTGVPYIGGGGHWNPSNLADGMVDCSGYVAKIWQVRKITEVTIQNHDTPTDSLWTCDAECGSPNCAGSMWYKIPRENGYVQTGDVLTNGPTSCTCNQGGMNYHTVLYVSDNPTGEFLMYEATTWNGVNRAIYHTRTLLGTWGVRRRAQIEDPGIVGVQPNGTNTGNVHLPIVAAYGRNGGHDTVGVPSWNGGGFLVHTWGNGYTQDMHHGSVGDGSGALMQSFAVPDQAYYVYGAFWTVYLSKGGPDFLGYPTSDAYAWQGRVRQDFQSGWLEWTGCVTIHHYN